MKVVSFATARSFPELRPILDRSWTKRSRSSVIRANAWSPHRSIERQPTQRWVGSVVLVLNEMVLVLVMDAIAQQSYLLVIEDDFARAAVLAKVMVEG